MQRDGQTDMTKLIVASHKFAKAPKKRRKQTADSTYQSTGLVNFTLGLFNEAIADTETSSHMGM